MAIRGLIRPHRRAKKAEKQNVSWYQYRVVIDYCPDFQVDITTTAIKELDALDSVVKSNVDSAVFDISITELKADERVKANAYVYKMGGSYKYFFISIRPFNLIL